MFWTDWADEPGARIERANMDGTGRRVVVDSHILWPNGVAVDMENDKIIWCDAATEVCENAVHPVGKCEDVFCIIKTHVYFVLFKKRLL